MIRYFISYAFQDTRGIGNGNCEIHRAEPIRSMDDITALTDLLRRNGVDNPTILSFCRFDGTADRRRTR
jgi:hypothetical protein